VAAGGVTALLAGLVVLTGLLVEWPMKAAGPLFAPRSVPSTAIAAAPPPSRGRPADIAPGPFAADARGFTERGPRCDRPQRALALARTERSLVVICSADDGRLEYVGVRLSDAAMLRTGAQRAAGGFVGHSAQVDYVVSATELVVRAGDTVIKREPVVDFVDVQANTPVAPR
jgi:hypothetical protein